MIDRRLAGSDGAVLQGFRGLGFVLVTFSSVHYRTYYSTTTARVLVYFGDTV